MVMKSVAVPDCFNKGTSKKSRRERKQREELFKAQDGKCYWCSEQMELNHFKLSAITGRTKENPMFATFEHLRPRSHGGGSSPKNIVLAHGSCNNNRHKRKFEHDPIYGNGPALPTPLNYPRQKVERKNRIKAKPIAETMRVLRGGYWMDKD